MFEKVAVIGESDLVFAFKALGLDVFAPRDLEETKKTIETLDRENYALCFVHQDFLEPLEEEREALVKKFCPVVVGFRDHRDVINYLGNIMREMTIKATGSDSLIKRKGKDERR
jgi:V/A-type H+-transporting ATPase subunit F